MGSITDNTAVQASTQYSSMGDQECMIFGIDCPEVMEDRLYVVYWRSESIQVSGHKRAVSPSKVMQQSPNALIKHNT